MHFLIKFARCIQIKNIVIRKYRAILICALFVKITAGAQINHDIKDTPDTLNLFERLSVSTNVVDWTLLLPNITLEYDISGLTWNRWSLALKLRGNWQTNYHTYKPAQVWCVQGIRGEIKHYWRTRLVTNIYPKNKKIYKRLLSCRRDSLMEPNGKGGGGEENHYLKHPNTTYYRGVYAEYSKFSYLLGKHGKQGKLAGVGVLYGIIKPLYQFSNGNALDLDMGISGGIYLASYQKYKHDRESDCYHVYGAHGKHIVPFPMISEVKLGLVYRFTNDANHQLPERYRWRYDVDKKYRDRLDSLYKRKVFVDDSIAKVEKNMGMLQNYFDSIFSANYPALYEQSKAQADEKAKKAKEEAEAAKKNKAQAIADAKKKKAEAEAEARKKKAEEKAAKKAKGKEVKEENTQTVEEPAQPTEEKPQQAEEQQSAEEQKGGEQ